MVGRMTVEVLLAPIWKPSQPVHAGARKPICDQGALAKKVKKDGAVLGLFPQSRREITGGNGQAKTKA